MNHDDFRLMFVGIVLLVAASAAQGAGYPEATLDQATVEVKCALRIDRHTGLDEQELQAEYQWALDMGRLCLDNPEVLRRDKQSHDYAIEFQRHAGRTSRYRGFLEQAIEDYETAIDYVYESARLVADTEFDFDPCSWEEVTLRDVADTYLLMGAYEPATAVTNEIIGRKRARGEADPEGPPELDRLAKIAERQGRFAEAVDLQRKAVARVGRDCGAKYLYLQRHPELSHIDVKQPWANIVRHPDVRRALDDADYDDLCHTNMLREAYVRLARALRFNRQLDEAAYALETAWLTPWRTVTTYRERLGLYVDREGAFLALARGRPEEAVQRAEACLDTYVMSHSERVELFDLVSRALEQLGDLQGAFDKLEEAIEIVETRRANLILDENKQLFVASYASLYRRALDLVVRINEDKGADAINQSFEWSERVKARAMLDTINRLDRRMARAIATGDTDAMRRTRDLAGRVVSIDELRNASWWPKDALVLEYTYGGKKGPRGQGIEGSRDRGSEEVYLWVVTSKGGSFHKLAVRADEVDKRCDALAEALRPHDERSESWVEPASWLYEHTIAPVGDKLQGIKRLIIVGDGKLRTTPFEVFVTARNARPNRYVRHHLLIEDFAIAYAPSATLLDSISRRERPKAWDYSLWAFASTKFKDAPDRLGSRSHRGFGSGSKPYKLILRSARSMLLDDLPYAAREVEQVASRFQPERCKVLVNRPNMKTTLLEASETGTLRSVRFLHFATHTVTDPGRPYLTGLVLSPPYPSVSQDAEPEPESEVASKIGASRDGKPVLDKATWGRKRPSRPELLTIGELTALDLRSELVVLSACRSLGDKAIEGDWLNGLTRAFLVAGGSGVLCTTSETADRVAISVVPTLYHALRTQGNGATTDVPLALQRVKQSRLGSPMYGHPSTWAPWVYHGRASGGAMVTGV